MCGSVTGCVCVFMFCAALERIKQSIQTEECRTDCKLKSSGCLSAVCPAVRKKISDEYYTVDTELIIVLENQLFTEQFIISFLQFSKLPLLFILSLSFSS